MRGNTASECEDGPRSEPALVVQNVLLPADRDDIVDRTDAGTSRSGMHLNDICRLWAAP